VTRNSVAYATYVYNALEQLVSRTTSASGGPIGTVHYIHDLDGHVIAEATGSTGATQREYIWLPSNDNYAVDLPLSVVANVATTPVLYQVHTDHLGRPVRMTDAAKAAVWQATWKPWGEPQSITGTQANDMRFPGQWFQIETGQAYNWNRHYDPVTGRYTQPDPLRFVDGPSVYQYARSTPFVKSDRDGRHITYDGTPNGPGVFLPTFPWMGLGPLVDGYLHNHLPPSPPMCMAGQLPNSPPLPRVAPRIPVPLSPGGGGCTCTCRAGDANQGGLLGYAVVSSTAPSCPQAAVDACKAAVNRVQVSNLHHVRAVCSNGKSYSGGGIPN
jgi:RHS repeat-associated protein